MVYVVITVIGIIVILVVALIMASRKAVSQQMELEQAKNEIKIKEDQLEIASRPTLSRESLLERMCREANMPVSYISDPESRDGGGIEDPR